MMSSFQPRSEDFNSSEHELFELLYYSGESGSRSSIEQLHNINVHYKEGYQYAKSDSDGSYVAVNPTTAVKRSALQVNEQYTNFVQSLPDDNNTSFQYNSNYSKQFDDLREKWFKENEWKDPPAFDLDRFPNDGYTHFLRNKRDYAGYTFVYGKNICYNFHRRKYIFLYNTRKVSVHDIDMSFRYGWKFVNHRNNITEERAMIIDTESVITQPYTIHHIYHFVESINFLWLKLMRINQFPIIRQLWLPTFNNKTDYPWATDYVRVLRDVFGSGYGLQVIDNPTLQALLNDHKKKEICFRKVMLLDRSHYLGDGGSINGWMPADLLRAAFYKFADIHMKTLSKEDVYQLRLVQRTGKRRFIHEYQLVERINRQFEGRVKAEVYYTNCSLADQIRIFAYADMILTPHGAGETNVMFMRPHTVLMEAFAPYFYECSFMSLSNIVRVRYMSITTYNETYLAPKARPGAGQQFYEKGILFNKRKYFITSYIDPNPLNIYATVDNAAEYLDYYRNKQRVHRDTLIF